MENLKRRLFIFFLLISCFCFGEVHAACPAGFIDTSFGFCLMKYEAKNVGGVANSVTDGLPWNLSQIDAKQKCNDIGGHLVTNSE